MRTILLILLSLSATAQQADPRMAYSQYTRLGINGPVKTVTAYKYTDLQYNTNDKKATKGFLYSVIKNWYDSNGMITRDSTALFINKHGGVRAVCRSYDYELPEDKHVFAIAIATEKNCLTNNYDPLEYTFLVFKPDNGNAVTATEYSITKGQKNMQYGYSFIYKDTLLQQTTFTNLMEKGNVQTVYSTFEYDKYGNFTSTTEKMDERPQTVTRHNVLTIDSYGNATQMLNFLNDAKEPEFMTVYEIEYYD